MRLVLAALLCCCYMTLSVRWAIRNNESLSLKIYVIAHLLVFLTESRTNIIGKFVGVVLLDIKFRLLSLNTIYLTLSASNISVAIICMTSCPLSHHKTEGSVDWQSTEVRDSSEKHSHYKIWLTTYTLVIWQWVVMFSLSRKATCWPPKMPVTF